LKSYPEIGLPVSPGAWRISSRHYSPKALTHLVVLTHDSKSPRVFLKTLRAELYREVELPSHFEAVEVVVPVESSLVFVHGWTASKPKIERTFQLDLPDGNLSSLPELQPQNAGDKVWVSHVYSSSPDGTGLFVAVGVSHPPTGDPPHYVEYWVALRVAKTGEFKTLYRLGGPHA